jgi:hypothetical protein
MIGVVPNATFPRATRIRYDYGSATGGMLIGHVDDFGLCQVSRLDLVSGPIGAQPINATSGGFILPPTFRQKEYGVSQRYGGTLPTTPVHAFLSGSSIADLCVNDLPNQGGAAGQLTPFNSGLSTPSFRHSRKDAIKGGGPAITPRFLFVALSDRGKIDVFETRQRPADDDAVGARRALDRRLLAAVAAGTTSRRCPTRPAARTRVHVLGRRRSACRRDHRLRRAPVADVFAAPGVVTVVAGEGPATEPGGGAGSLVAAGHGRTGRACLDRGHFVVQNAHHVCAPPDLAQGLVLPVRPPRHRQDHLAAAGPAGRALVRPRRD